MDQVEEIKSKVDMVQLVGEYVKLTKAGRNFKGLCPFHGEKTPSFMVNPELQIYKCFGCNEGGDAYSFLQKMEGMEFGEALRILAKRVGITLESYVPSKGEETRDRLIKINNQAAEFYHYLLTKHRLGEPARAYLKARKISEKAVEVYKLGFGPDGWDYLIKYLAGKKGFETDDLTRAGLVVDGKYDRFRNRIMFPLNNHRGQTVGFAGRVMPSSAEASEGQAGGKYINTPETEIYHKGDLLYGLDVNRTEVKSAGLAVVVEGEIDAIASWQAGVANVVAIKGSALTPRQVEILKRYTDTVALSLDADLAGDMAARRGIEIAEKAGLIIKVINPKSETFNPKHYKDPGDFATADPEGWVKAVAGAVPVYDYYIDSAVERHGLSGVGKAKIGRELIPIWIGIEDEIAKGHYIKKLAEVLGVEEGDVRKQMEKTVGGKTGEISSAREAAEKKEEDLRERREKRLVQVAILGGKIAELTRAPLRGLIKTGFWQRVADEFSKGTSLTKLPAELAERVAELTMTEEEYTDSLWEEAGRLLEMVGVSEKLGGSPEPAEAVKLAKRKAELTRER